FLLCSEKEGQVVVGQGKVDLIVDVVRSILNQSFQDFLSFPGGADGLGPLTAVQVSVRQIAEHRCQVAPQEKTFRVGTKQVQNQVARLFVTATGVVKLPRADQHHPQIIESARQQVFDP